MLVRTLVPAYLFKKANTLEKNRGSLLKVGIAAFNNVRSMIAVSIYSIVFLSPHLGMELFSFPDHKLD